MASESSLESKKLFARRRLAVESGEVGEVRTGVAAYEDPIRRREAYREPFDGPFRVFLPFSRAAYGEGVVD